ncbi:MAG TPA: zinc ribbon domain-containing protein [Streptosporangiaceae bacterium]
MDVTCINCGGILPESDLYCGNCGTSRFACAEPPAPTPRAAGDGGQPVPAARPAEWAVSAPSAAAQAPLDSGLAQVKAAIDTSESSRSAENVRYADRRLAYTTMRGRGNLDPVFNARLHLQLLRHAAVFAGLYAALQSVVVILFLLLAVAGMGFSSALSMFGMFTIGSLITLTALFWLLPVPALLTQWSLMVEHKSAAASTVFRHITSAFNQHHTPLDSLRVRNLAPAGEGRRDYLELRRDDYCGYVSCFPHGHDLYVSWTFWLRLSPLRLLLMMVERRIQNMTGRGDDIHQTLRFESARATVAALHSAALEGVDAATAELDPEAPRLLGNASSFAFEL